MAKKDKQRVCTGCGESYSLKRLRCPHCGEQNDSIAQEYVSRPLSMQRLGSGLALGCGLIVWSAFVSSTFVTILLIAAAFVIIGGSVYYYLRF
jgi:predicted RNA-binding Zn-ribbon protein involved in translation (DUF1610 family)